MRYPSIDVLRTIAILLMVLVHFAENLSASVSYGWVPAGFAAPLFTFLSGVSYRLWLNLQEARGRTDTEISKRTVRRGLFLFGLGFAFNIVVWLPEDTYNWDVLTFIGAALVILNLARRLDAMVLWAICLVAFVVSPFLRAAADYPAYWELGYFKPDLTLTDVLLGFIATGYFPALPWIIYPITGFVVAPLLFSAAATNPPPTRRLAGWGVALIGLSALSFALRRFASPAVQAHLLAGWTMFPPSIAYVTGTLGFALVACAVGRRWIDGNPRFAPDRRLGVVASTFSKHSLSIYVLHHVAHLWPLWTYGTLTGHEATHFWRMAMPEAVTVCLSVVFIVACYGLFRWMDRTGRGGIEALMRWVCD